MVVKSFFNLLKRERIRCKKYKTREDAWRDVFGLRQLKTIPNQPMNHIEFFYNPAAQTRKERDAVTDRFRIAAKIEAARRRGNEGLFKSRMDVELRILASIRQRPDI